MKLEAIATNHINTALTNPTAPQSNTGKPRRPCNGRGETKLYTSAIDLSSLRKETARGEEQLLSYFLDGSRHVYKVDDMGFEKSGNRTAIYPIIAGQIGVGCCRRRDRSLSLLSSSITELDGMKTFQKLLLRIK